MRRRARRGYALAMAILFLAVVFVLGLAYGARTSSQLQQTNHTVASMQAGYLAEGGLQVALERLHGDIRLPYQDTLTFGTGTATVSAVDLGEGRRQLSSVGRSGRMARFVRVSVDADFKVLSWTEGVL